MPYLYKAANNGEMITDPFVAETFDATMLLGLAAVAAQYTDTCDSIKTCLRRIANDNGDADPEIEPGDIKLAVSLLKKGYDINYEGAAGSQEIDANGDVNNTIEVWTIKDGKILDISNSDLNKKKPKPIKITETVLPKKIAKLYLGFII